MTDIGHAANFTQFRSCLFPTNRDEPRSDSSRMPTPKRLRVWMTKGGCAGLTRPRRSNAPEQAFDYHGITTRRKQKLHGRQSASIPCLLCLGLRFAFSAFTFLAFFRGRP